MVVVVLQRQMEETGQTLLYREQLPSPQQAEEVGDIMPAVVIREDQVEEEPIIIVEDPAAVLAFSDKVLQVVEVEALHSILLVVAVELAVLELPVLDLLQLLVE